MVAFDNSIFCLALHPDAKPRSTVDRAKDRVEYLVEQLKERNERILLPTPVLAEFLVLAGPDAPEYLAIIRESSVFRVEPFDERAAIELADIEITARAKGNKRGEAVASEWQKVKIDRQIVAVAKAHGVTALYSDDPDIKVHGKACGIQVLALADLPLPPGKQEQLFDFTPGTTKLLSEPQNPTEQKSNWFSALEAESDAPKDEHHAEPAAAQPPDITPPAPLRGGDNGSPENQADAEAAKEAKAGEGGHGKQTDTPKAE